MTPRPDPAQAPGRPVAAFHAPMKPPNHPTPSGDRRIARLTMRALERAGFAPRLISDLRTLELHGDPRAQAGLLAEAELEAERLLEELSDAPPAVWFTYHSYYKAPDLLGPRLSRALGIPYAISEPSHSPRRSAGPWAIFADASAVALRSADRLFWTTRRDLPGLERLLGADATERLVHLPAFVDLGPPPDRRLTPEGALRLLCVAMMRPGDKLASYRALANALALLDGPEWRLTVVGDGAARADVETLLAPFGDRVSLVGRVDDPDRLRALFEAAELLVWPGVGEGVGMIYLEAQAAGLPCLAEDRPGPADLIHGAALPPPDDPRAFADAIRRAASDREALAASGAAARAEMERGHGLDAAAASLRRALTPLLAEAGPPGSPRSADGGARP